jgi:hypothetical protein
MPVKHSRMVYGRDSRRFNVDHDISELDLSEIPTKNHSDLDNLTWSSAGHTIDQNVSFADFNITDVGNIALDSISPDATNIDINMTNGNLTANMGTGTFNVNTTADANNLVVDGSTGDVTIDVNAGDLKVTSTTYTNNLLVDGDTGKIGIISDSSVTSPTRLLDVVGTGSSDVFLDVRNAGTNANSVVDITAVTDPSSNYRPILRGRRARGDAFGSETNIQAGNAIFSLIGMSYINGAYRESVDIDFWAGSSISGSSYSAYMTFQTTAVGSTSRAERMRITEAGYVGINETNPSTHLHVNGSQTFDNTGTWTSGSVVLQDDVLLTFGDGSDVTMEWDTAPATDRLQITLPDSITEALMLSDSNSDDILSVNTALNMIRIGNASSSESDILVDSGSEVARLHISDEAGDGTHITNLYLHRHSTSSEVGASIYGARSNGTGEAGGGHGTVTDGMMLFEMVGLGYNAAGAGGSGEYERGAAIEFLVDGASGNDNDMPGQIRFKTSSENSSTPTTRLTIGNDGTATATNTWTWTGGGIGLHTGTDLTFYSDAGSTAIATFDDDSGDLDLNLTNSANFIIDGGQVGIGTASPGIYSVNVTTSATDNTAGFRSIVNEDRSSWTAAAGQHLFRYAFSSHDNSANTVITGTSVFQTDLDMVGSKWGSSSSSGALLINKTNIRIAGNSEFYGFDLIGTQSSLFFGGGSTIVSVTNDITAFDIEATLSNTPRINADNYFGLIVGDMGNNNAAVNASSSANSAGGVLIKNQNFDSDWTVTGRALVLLGDGAGSDIVFGAGQDAGIFWDGDELIVDLSATNYQANGDLRVITTGDANSFVIDGGNGNITINATAVSANYDLALAGDGVLAHKERTGTAPDSPTADSGYGKLWGHSNNNLYWQDGDGETHVVHGFPVYKSSTVTTQGLGVNPSVDFFGFLDYSAADANLTQASTTVTWGTANVSYAAHAFIVAGGAGVTDGSDLVLTVTGVSINDNGTRNAADSEVIVADCTAASANDWFETAKKWLGTVTFTLSSTGGTAFNFDFNYGFAKYEDFNNNDFTVIGVEAVGLAGANDTSNTFDIEILHYNSANWTYHATAFNPWQGSNIIASLQTDHTTADNELSNGDAFAWKRANLSTDITGSGSEGIIARLSANAANAVEYCDIHLAVEF